MDHILLLIVAVVTKSWVWLLETPTDCSPPGSSVHGGFSGKNIGVHCHFLPQGIFPTQGLNPCLLHWWANSLLLSYWGSHSAASVQSCPTLCDPMDYSTPDFPVHRQLLEFTQTHVHWVGDAIQPSHPLLCPSPSALNLSQHQGLFQSQFFTSGGQSIGVSASASVLPMNIQD